jgi:RNA polymerase sigma-70 factor, ECF subfamily
MTTATISVGAVVASDTKADFAEWYQASYPRLVSQIYAMTGDLAGAEDAVQEACSRAWLRWRQVSAYQDPRAWALTVAHRLAISRWRRHRTARAHMSRQRAADLLAPGPGPELVALVEALRALPAAQRRAVVLHHMGGYSVSEIAVVERVAEGTVKSWLSRGRNTLAQQLAEQEVASDPAREARDA